MINKQLKWFLLLLLGLYTTHALAQTATLDTTFADRFEFHHLRVLEPQFGQWQVWHKLRVYDTIHQHYCFEQEFNYSVKNQAELPFELQDFNQDGFIDFKILSTSYGSSSIFIHDKITHSFQKNDLLSKASNIKVLDSKYLLLTFDLGEIIQEITLQLPQLTFVNGKQFSAMQSRNRFSTIDSAAIRLSNHQLSESYFSQPTFLQLDAPIPAISTNRLHYFMGDTIVLVGNRLGALKNPEEVDFAFEQFNATTSAWESATIIDIYITVRQIITTENGFTWSVNRASEEGYPLFSGLGFARGKYRCTATLGSKTIAVSPVFYVHGN